MIILKASVNLYSTQNGEIEKFLTSFYNKKIKLKDSLKWNTENNDKYKINMWISLDNGVYINVTDYNADKIIRYIYERFPY